MQLILSFACGKVGELLSLRLIDRSFYDCIENYAFHIWIERVKIPQLALAFRDIRTYVIRQFLEARKRLGSPHINDNIITGLFVRSQWITINELLVKYWDINVSMFPDTEVIMTPLIEACSEGCLSRVRFLLENGANPILHGTKQMLPFDILLQKKTNRRFRNELNVVINLFKDKTLPPLMKAINEGNSDLALGLLQEGADIWVRDRNGRTPYILAVDKGMTKVADMIMEKCRKEDSEHA